MKFSLTMIGLALSLSALAGQNGSGTNICFPAADFLQDSVMNGLPYNGYRTFDEVKSHTLASTHLTDGSQILKGRRIENPNLMYKMFEGDMLTPLSAISARQRLAAIAMKDAELSKALVRLFDLLADVHVSSKPFQIYAQVGTQTETFCKRGSIRSVILSRPTGIILFSEPIWNKLPFQTQEVALIHETLRLAQLHTSWFAKASNDDIEALAMQIYAGNTQEVVSHTAFSRFHSYVDFMQGLPDEKLTAVVNLAKREWLSTLSSHGARPAFKMILSGIEGQYFRNKLRGTETSDDLDYSIMNRFKRESRFMTHVVEDLINEFGLKGP